MPEAELFDGTVLEFPEGTSPDVINQTVKRETLLARSKAGEIDTRSGAPSYMRALVGGAPTKEDRLKTLQKFFPDATPDPNDPDNFIFTNPETGTPTLYNPKGPDIGDIASMSREGVQAVGGAVGATVGAGAGGAAGLAGGPAAPVTSPVGAFAGGVAGAGLGGAAGGEAFDLVAKQAGMSDSRTAGEHVADTGASVLSNAAGQAGGMSLQALLSTALKIAIRGGGSAAAKNASEKIADFAKVGATPTAGQATENRALLNIEGVLSKAPGAAGFFGKRAQATIDKIDEFVAKRSQALASGQKLEPEVAGRSVVKGVDAFVQKFKDRSGALFNELDKHIAATDQIGASNTVTFLQKASAPIAGAENVSKTKLLDNPVIRDVAKALEADAAANGGTIPYAALKEIRSRIGQRLASPSLVDDIPRGELKQLYGAVSEDLKAAAKAAGPDAEKAFNRANDFYKAGIQRIDDVLQPLVDKGVPEKVFKSLETGGKEGATTLRATMRSLDQKERDIVAGTVLSRLGKAKPGQQDATGEAFSVETYLTNWNGLSKEAKDVLFDGTSLKGLRKDLDTVARVTEQMRESARAFSNPSGTAGNVTGQTLAYVGGGSALFGLFTGDLTSLGLAGTLAGGATVSNLAARLMNSPRFVHWLAESTKLRPNGLMPHLGRLAAIAATSDEGTRQQIKDYISAIGSLTRTGQSRSAGGTPGTTSPAPPVAP